jgi:hypothetical protein
MTQGDLFAAPGAKREDFTSAASASQCDMILGALRRGERLTPLDALRRFGCLRLAARVDDLRSAGHRISTEMVTAGGKRYAVYRLEA